MKISLLFVLALSAVVLGASGFLATVHATTPSPLAVDNYQGYGCLAWHLGSTGQTGTAYGKADLGFNFIYTAFAFWGIQLTINGVTCYWTITSLVVKGECVTISGNPVTSIEYVPSSMQYLSSPITIIVCNNAPYLAVAFGKDVFFVGQGSTA
jgi:hypothetical protein